MENRLRQLPSVDKLLAEDRIKELQAEFPHSLIVDTIRKSLERCRLDVSQGKEPPPVAEIAETVYTEVQSLANLSLRPIINATGVVLHTNLGRAPLSDEAIAAMQIVAKGYSNLEFDVARGDRGSRQVHVEQLLCRLTGAEAALVVNNNASAVLLVLTALARRKEVIVSRGQAVEIGGGFRIPDVMRQSGAKLVEVGTTNITNIRDYEQAITPRTAALLRVHSSNFKVVGFTQMVTIEEMAALGNQYKIPVLDDLGSGCMLDTTRFGLDAEPMVQTSVAVGVALACFSGDKLLGGPQAGIIVGRKELVDRLKKHPLARAMRIDKLGLAALSATLIHYLKGEALSKIPVWRMISMSLAEIERRAALWVQPIKGMATVIDGESLIGGGSLPGGTLPTKLVAIKGERLSKDIAQKLRTQQPPVIGRVSGNTLLLDPRTVPQEDDALVVKLLGSVADSLKK